MQKTRQVIFFETSSQWESRVKTPELIQWRLYICSYKIYYSWLEGWSTLNVPDFLFLNKLAVLTNVLMIFLDHYKYTQFFIHCRTNSCNCPMLLKAFQMYSMRPLSKPYYYFSPAVFISNVILGDGCIRKSIDSSHLKRVSTCQHADRLFSPL